MPCLFFSVGDVKPPKTASGEWLGRCRIGAMPWGVSPPGARGPRPASPPLRSRPPTAGCPSARLHSPLSGGPPQHSSRHRPLRGTPRCASCHHEVRSKELSIKTEVYIYIYYPIVHIRECLSRSVAIAFRHLPVRIPQEGSEHDGESRRYRGHQVGTGKCAGLFRHDSRDAGPQGLARAEEEGEDREPGRRARGTEVVAYRGRHDRRNAPGSDSVQADRQVEAPHSRVCAGEAVGDRLDREDRHESPLAPDPVRKHSEKRAGEETEENHPGPELHRRDFSTPA